jgi:hypothetical protein
LCDLLWEHFSRNQIFILIEAGSVRDSGGVSPVVRIRTGKNNDFDAAINA